MTITMSGQTRVKRALVRWTLILLALCAGLAPSPARAAPGAPLANFATTGGGTRLMGAAAQPDGKTVAVGESGADGNPTLLLARFTTSGALDPSFGSGGESHGPPVASSLGDRSLGRAVALQADGKIVVVGTATGADGSYRGGLIVERFNSNGGLDTSFGAGGVVRLFATSFGDGYSVAIQSDQKIVVGGSSDAAGSGGTAPRVALARLNINGSLDGGFGAGGLEVLDLGPYSYATALAIQPDGKVVLVGSQAPGLQVPNALIARVTTGGALDPSFNGSGAFARQYALGAASSGFNAVAVQGDGKIVAAGGADDGNSGADSIVVRFTASGAQDASFGAGGVAYTTSGANLFATANTSVPGARAVAVLPGGEIVTAGTLANGVSTVGALEAFDSAGHLIDSFGSHGFVASPAPSGNGEDAGLAVAPDGTISTVGDTSAPATTQFAGTGARYAGFGAATIGVPALRIVVVGASGRYRIKVVLKTGIKVGVGCNEACSIGLKLLASAHTAQQLKLGKTVKTCAKRNGKRRCRTTIRYSQITAASAGGRLGSAGLRSFVLKLSRSVARAAGKQKSFRLTLMVSVTSNTSHTTQSMSKTLTLSR